MWPYLKERVTAADLLESGACYGGVCNAVLTLGLLSAPLVDALAHAKHDRSYVEAAANSNNGNGNGDGDGDGDGDGYGNGNGYGDGDGYGYGYGYG